MKKMALLIIGVIAIAIVAVWVCATGDDTDDWTGMTT